MRGNIIPTDLDVAEEEGPFDGPYVVRMNSTTTSSPPVVYLPPQPKEHNKQHEGCCHSVFPSVVTLILLGMGFVLVGIPPLFISSHRSRLVYVAIMIPILTIVGASLQYYVIEGPLRHLYRILDKVGSSLSEAEKNAETPPPTLSATSRRSDIDAHIRWLDAKQKKLTGLQRDYAEQPELRHEHKAFCRFLERSLALHLSLIQQCRSNLFGIMPPLTRSPSVALNSTRRSGVMDDYDRHSDGPTVTRAQQHHTMTTSPSSHCITSIEASPLTQGSVKLPQFDSVLPGSEQRAVAAVLMSAVLPAKNGPPAALPQPTAVTAAPSSTPAKGKSPPPAESLTLSPSPLMPATPAADSSAPSETQQWPQRPVAPPTIVLRRGNRFPTDTANVFFYVEVIYIGSKAQAAGGSDAPTSLCAFEALVQPPSRGASATTAAAFFELSTADKQLPFVAFSLRHAPRPVRQALTAEETDYFGLVHCEVEEDMEQTDKPIDLTSLEVKTTPLRKGRSPTPTPNTKPPAADGESPFYEPPAMERANSYVMAFGPLRGRPLRLTSLEVQLENPSSPSSPPLTQDQAKVTRAATVPVIECLVDNILCVLSKAVVTVDASTAAVLSVQLHGVSIEDLSGSSASSTTSAERREEGGPRRQRRNPKQAPTIGQIIMERVDLTAM